MRYESKKAADKQKTNKQVPVTNDRAFEQDFAGNEADTTMESNSNSVSDKLQANIVNESGRLISILNKEGYITNEYGEKYRHAKSEISKLKDFHYTVGFAGGMSAGKSTVMNAIIRYPLMPVSLQATTCIPVEMIYSDRIRIVVYDDDLNSVILDYPCDKKSKQEFEKLRRYTCAAYSSSVIENLQSFTDVYVRNTKTLTAEQLDMDYKNPKHTAVLMLILLAVDVSINKNYNDLTEQEKKIINLRNETLRYFGITKDNINLSITIQWDAPLLKSGMRLLDLPGLGANAMTLQLENGREKKGHDDIATEAIVKTDSMVYLSGLAINASGLEALRKMIGELVAREAVDPGNCIIPIVNVHDNQMIDGAQIENGLTKFADLITQYGRDAKIIKTVDDIKQCVAIYGEYDYLDLPNKERTLFVKAQIEDAIASGYTEEDIEDMKMKPMWITTLKKKYERSGINEIRDFFRVGFIEKGKYRKSFTAIMSMKALQLELTSGINALIETDKLFANVSAEIATEVIDTLRGDASKPIAEDQGTLANMVQRHQEKAITIMDGIAGITADKYIKAFRAALNKYIENGKNKASAMTLSNNPMHWGHADIEQNAANKKLFQELQTICASFSPDLIEVNTEYANALRYCDEDIEEIYQRAEETLAHFQKSYELTLQSKIEGYKDKVNASTLKILESMIPVIADLVDKVLESSKSGMMSCREKIKESAKELASKIITINDECTSAHVEHVCKPFSEFTHGIIFQRHTYVNVNGTDGIMKKFNTASLSVDDEKLIRDAISTACCEGFVNPINQWYLDVNNSIQQNLNDLLKKIGTFLNETETLLKEDVLERKERLNADKRKLKNIEKMFDEMKKGIKDSVQEALVEGQSILSDSAITDWLEIGVKNE